MNTQLLFDQWLCWSVIVMLISVFLSFLSGSVLGLPSDQCTSIGVGYLAMADKSAIATHNDDCNECDIRVTHVPARDWKKNSMRPVFATRPPYPRSVPVYASLI
jgi:hypothetical protein